MIEGLLPRSVRVAEAFGDRTDIELFPQESAAIERAVEKRRREFTTVRACARDALAVLGVDRVPLVPGQRGAPQWPAGVVGSMTHCEGYCAAVVAHRDDVDSIGIDAEPDAPLPVGLLEVVSVTEELAGLHAVASTGVAADRLLFSAKESVYKAWFPLTGRWLGFEQASVTLRPTGTFTARLLVDGMTADGRRLTSFEGRWTAGRGLVLTAVAVPRAGRASAWAAP